MTPSGPASLDLVRHAESEGNLADRRAHDAGAAELVLAGRDADVELSATGVRQAAALGRWITSLPAARRPQAVISSPYRRARQTAEAAIGGGLDVPLLLDERLRERELGVFDGLTARGIVARYPEEAQRRARLGKFYYRPPGGESWVDVALRVRSVLAALRDYDGLRLLLVTHQAVIMNFRYVLEQLTEDQILAEDAGPPLANCSVTRYVARQPGMLTLETYNEVPAAAPVTAEPAAEEPDAVRS
jgi:broad specificity phosphatase PhoE